MELEEKQDQKAADKLERGGKKIRNQEQTILDGNGLFKSYSNFFFDNLCQGLKNKDNIIDSAAFNNTKTMVNFYPKIKHHRELKSVVSKQTFFSYTIPISFFDTLSELLTPYSTNGKFDPNKYFETFMRNCNPLAEIKSGMSYKKFDISGFS